MSLKYDIFCKIVDNFGDIGVCWRISQQLSNTPQIDVRLFIDDFAIASKIIPTLDINKTVQTIAGVTVQAWPIDAVDLPNVVIENFSCQLPAGYAKQVAAHNNQYPASPIIWINLDHLSAEDWVESCHALPSTHPTLGYTRYFFYPGFTRKTAGLLREEDLIETRDAFQASDTAQAAFWDTHSLATPNTKEGTTLKVSLFSYPQADISTLVNALSQQPKAVTLLLPYNTEITALNDLIGTHQLSVNQPLNIGNVTLHLMPFLSQTSYDQLLWACDLNIVRGEDSWIRAIWAGKPFIWQPYIQSEDTHITKLNAFLCKYTQHCEDARLKDLIIDAHLVWSNAKIVDANDFWETVTQALPEWQSYSTATSNNLAAQDSLSKQLVTFIQQVESNK